MGDFRISEPCFGSGYGNEMTQKCQWTKILCVWVGEYGKTVMYGKKKRCPYTYGFGLKDQNHTRTEKNQYGNAPSAIIERFRRFMGPKCLKM